jgi:tRNA A-37 threonylcarbamoyl transferase component Bud32/tetratricopeptide (TPR) repeat protein
MAGSEVQEGRIQPLQVGQTLARGGTIGRYMVLGLVGRGAMGDVYLAHDPKLARKVAVKLVRTQDTDASRGAESRLRLLREAQAIAKLSHPNVVVVHDVGTFRDSVFLAMEYVEGPTVTAWLHAAPRSWREVLALYVAAGRGLAAAHAVGMVHRDFKPDNVMVGRDGHARVLDFGLARQVPETVAGEGALPDGEQTAQAVAARLASADDVDATAKIGAPVAAPRPADDKLTRTGAMVGTPAYMAPEQFLGHPTDARTDQFSFCVALYEGLYACRPFAGNTIIALTTNVVEGKVLEPPAEARIPAHIRNILLRGLAADPAARWPSMEALLDALSQDPAQPRRRWQGAVGLGLAAFLLVAGAAGWRTSRNRPRLCTPAADKLAGVWEPGGADTPCKAAVRRAFLATSRAYAPAAFAGVAQILDRYARAWGQRYEQACRATRPRSEASEARLGELRLACFEQNLGRLRATVDVLAEATPAVVDSAAAAASALPALDRCTDTATLRAVLAPPLDDDGRARAAALARDLARVQALDSAGRCAAALADGQATVRGARALGHLPLAAEALNALAGAEVDCDQPEAAVRDYKEALRAALASRHEEAAVTAAMLLAGILAQRPAGAGEARDWLEVGRAILRPIAAAHPELEARAYTADAALAAQEGDHQAALADLQRALALDERATAGDFETARALERVGAALADVGRFEESAAVFDRACSLTEQLLGPGHPRVAACLAEREKAAPVRRAR